MTDVAIAGILGASVALLFIRLRQLQQRLHRLSRLEAKIDALLEHAGIAFDPFRDVPEGVREALERGETITAIKRVREVTGVTLAEAKDVVDDVRRRMVRRVVRP